MLQPAGGDNRKIIPAILLQGIFILLKPVGLQFTAVASQSDSPSAMSPLGSTPEWGENRAFNQGRRQSAASTLHFTISAREPELLIRHQSAFGAAGKAVSCSVSCDVGYRAPSFSIAAL